MTCICPKWKLKWSPDWDWDDANVKLYDKCKLSETTHTAEKSTWKPGLPHHWRRLCRRDRTQFYRDDRVAVVVCVVLDNGMSVSIWSSQSDDRYHRDDIWEPGFIRKLQTARDVRTYDRDDYMKTRLNAGFFTRGHNEVISLMKPLLHVETFRWNLCTTALRNKFQQAFHCVTWSVSWNFLELPVRGKYHVK